MPQDKWNLEEIKNGVIWEMEGIRVIGIAKKLTDINLNNLFESGVISRSLTLKTLIEINHQRDERSSIKTLIEKMKRLGGIRDKEMKAITEAIVHPNRIRRLMKSDLWCEYKNAFRKEHIQQIAKLEATKHIKSKEEEKNP